MTVARMILLAGIGILISFAMTELMNQEPEPVMVNLAYPAPGESSYPGPGMGEAVQVTAMPTGDWNYYGTITPTSPPPPAPPVAWPTETP